METETLGEKLIIVGRNSHVVHIHQLSNKQQNMIFSSNLIRWVIQSTKPPKKANLQGCLFVIIALIISMKNAKPKVHWYRSIIQKPSAECSNDTYHSLKHVAFQHFSPLKQHNYISQDEKTFTKCTLQDIYRTSELNNKCIFYGKLTWVLEYKDASVQRAHTHTHAQTLQCQPRLVCMCPRFNNEQNSR